MTRQLRYFEDLAPGLVLEFGDRLITAEEIVAFARDYDPQPFHLDEAAGRQTHFGGLVASGWQTCGIMMRLMVDNYLCPETSLGSPGLDELRWLRPVRPGDRLRVRLEVLETRVSRSRPEMGTVRQRTEVLNQKDEVVMTTISVGMIRRRESAL
ncbi:MaoC family dehydratase [Niveispirillum sp. BGYR6]|uniref:MaoC family dehydratase n=1 Tax=Niveispirillum sp. BGYR6 TaxID=2971249 RepID=UPI0022B9A385|nr:MaoC family dehydratase [Niveispirillum sp. BGYR6]MDG5497978.1 MaoC family dehydratase [Niveispirillum sp. BGYR6]